MALLPGLLLRKWLEVAGARLALCLCLSVPELLGEQPTVASFAATDYLGQEKWKKQPTQKEATAPKAKETHQAQNGWFIGNFQHPKPLLLKLGCHRSSTCKPRECRTGTNHFLSLVSVLSASSFYLGGKPLKAWDFNPAVISSELVARNILSSSGRNTSHSN